MNTDLWVEPITKYGAPAYPCPHCGKGILVLEKQTLVKHETVASLQQADEWHPDPASTVYAFSCWLKCAAPTCQGMVAVVGTGGLEEHCDEDDHPIWEEYFTARHAWPMPDVFSIPNKCPGQVSRELSASFDALWSHQASAASRLRVALEYLLDEVGVTRRRRAKSGYEKLPLHQRIEVLSKSQPDIGTNLMAVKWFGNTGSHPGGVAMADVLNAYEIMEHALDALVGQRGKRAAALARHLRKRHAPVRRTRVK